MRKGPRFVRGPSSHRSHAGALQFHDTIAGLLLHSYPRIRYATRDTPRARYIDTGGIEEIMVRILYWLAKIPRAASNRLRSIRPRRVSAAKPPCTPLSHLLSFYHNRRIRMWVDSWVCPPVLCPPARPPLPFTPREDRPRFRPEGKQTGARSAEGFPVGFDPRPGHDVNRLFRSILLNHFAFFVDCFITVFLHAFRCPETQ